MNDTQTTTTDEPTPKTAPHCFRPPMPIEAMIDIATGRDPQPVRRTVTLVCPHCKRTMRVVMDPTDPPGCAEVHSTCDKCPDDAAVIDYFNAAGQQISCDGDVL